MLINDLECKELLNKGNQLLYNICTQYGRPVTFSGTETIYKTIPGTLERDRVYLGKRTITSDRTGRVVGKVNRWEFLDTTTRLPDKKEVVASYKVEVKKGAWIIMVRAIESIIEDSSYLPAWRVKAKQRERSKGKMIIAERHHYRMHIDKSRKDWTSYQEASLILVKFDFKFSELLLDTIKSSQGK